MIKKIVFSILIVFFINNINACEISCEYNSWPEIMSKVHKLDNNEKTDLLNILKSTITSLYWHNLYYNESFDFICADMQDFKKTTDKIDNKILRILSDMLYESIIEGEKLHPKTPRMNLSFCIGICLDKYITAVKNLII